MRSRKQSIPGNRFCNPQGGILTTSAVSACLFLLAAYSAPLSATVIACTQGKKVSTDLGGGVVMHTCTIKNTTNTSTRTGPLALEKNGVLILRLETDANGKLHGQYTSWDDNGRMTEKGNYLNGLKEGEWITVDENGEHSKVHYRAGNVVDP